MSHVSFLKGLQDKVRGLSARALENSSKVVLEKIVRGFVAGHDAFPDVMQWQSLQLAMGS